MERFEHYTNFSNLDEAIVGFCRFCRDSELSIGLSHSSEALHAMRSGFMSDRQTMKSTLRSLFCSRPEDHESFERCFDIFWGDRQHDYQHRVEKVDKSTITLNRASAVLLGFDPSPKAETQEEVEASRVTGVSKMDIFKKVDFRELAQWNSDLIDRLTEQLLQQLNQQLRRKSRISRKGRVDIRRTIRNNIHTGDLLLELAHRRKKRARSRIVLILDVSGSMDQYSFFLLKFMWALKSKMNNIEAFIFSTRLVRITDLIGKQELDEAVQQLSEEAIRWSGGTKIGECLEEFNENYSRLVLNGKSITIVLSDGLDDGRPGFLAEQLKKIRMRTTKLIWLNPLKGMEGYQPLAQGMKAAMEEIDVFGSAHNFQSLLELEKILADV
jgi:uncharacterized protein with von Willebrand factor type A (vWA) domain